MALFSNRPGSRDDSSSERGKEKKKKNDASNGGRTFLERYALWSHRNPLLALTCIVLVAVACILTVVLNDELQFVETNDREWVILKDEITSDADAASEGTRLVEECVLLLDSFFFFVFRVFLRYFTPAFRQRTSSLARNCCRVFFCSENSQRDVSFLFVLASSRSRERKRERKKMGDDIVDAAFSLFPQFLGNLRIDLFLVSEGRDAFRKEKNLGGD